MPSENTTFSTLMARDSGSVRDKPLRRSQIEENMTVNPPAKEPSWMPSCKPILGPLKSKILPAHGRILDVSPCSSRTNGHRVKQRAVPNLSSRKGLRTIIDRVSNRSSVVPRGKEDGDQKLGSEILCCIAPQPGEL